MSEINYNNVKALESQIISGKFKFNDHNHKKIVLDALDNFFQTYRIKDENHTSSYYCRRSYNDLIKLNLIKGELI